MEESTLTTMGPDLTMLALIVVVATALLLPCLVVGSSSAGSRNVLALTEWAKEQGIEMHPSLQFKEYKNINADIGNEASSNWGIELSEPVKPGTVLLQVPRELCLEANALKKEFEATFGAEKLQSALDALGPEMAQNHEDNFWIVLKLFQLCRGAENKDNNDNNRWSPWVQAIPRAFTKFSKAEQECLPYYAKYAAEYQDQKFEAFCKAAAALGELSQQDGSDDTTCTDTQDLQWAFHAVGSRFWKTSPPPDSSALPTSELVPIGDMFNHREPPNVQIKSHQRGPVKFIFDGEEGEKDLYITYGQPSNPHRFLVIFGFCPTDMPTMWSQMSYPDNPFSADVSNMVFQVQPPNQDGDNGSSSRSSTITPMIPKIVWDAVLFALDEPPKGSPTPAYTAERHNRPHVRKYTRQVLEHHVAQQLSELAACREKIESVDTSKTNAQTMELIRQHNAFVTGVFQRVQDHLQETSEQDVIATTE